MKFLDPKWLWFLCALPVFFTAIWYGQKRKEKILSQFVGNALWKSIIPEFDPRLRLWRSALSLLALAMVIIALARPSWGEREEKMKVTGLDILFLLDISNSMAVEDVAPNRLLKSKHLIRTIVDRLPGDRVGLIPFAGSSFVAVPLTTDVDYFKEILDSLEPNAIKNQGTDFAVALESAATAIERGAVNVGESVKPDAEAQLKSNVVVLVSDGEDLEGRVKLGIERVKKVGARFFAFGVGTAKGGPVPRRDQNGVLDGYIEERGKPVISRFNSTALEKISDELGGTYWNITENESEAQELLAAVEAFNRNELSEKSVKIHTERYQVPLCIGILFLITQFFVSMRVTQKSKTNKQSSPAISRGAVTAMFLGALLGSEAAAKEPDPRAYWENRQALELHKKGEADQAKSKFDRALEIDPSQPGLYYNRGALDYEAGKIEDAVQGFNYSAEEASKKGDHPLSSKSFYNLGSSLEGAGQIPGAVQSYLNAIDQAKRSQDPELEEWARQRLAQLPEMQKQQKQGGGESQENEPKDPNDQQKQGNQGKREFKSKKLSKEDVERVMAELNNRDKDVKRKFKRNEKQGGDGGGKNW